MPQDSPCPSRDELESGVKGGLAPQQVEQLARHVESCPECEQTVQSLCADETVGLGAKANPLLAQARRQAKEIDAAPSEIRKSLLDVGNRPTMSFMGGPASAVDALDFLAPPESADELGRIGQYRALKILGQGGMGMVLLAHDPHLDRHVALKIMLPKVAADESAKQRFLREARAAAKLKSDHIVTIYQVGEDRGVPFLAMEYLQGAPLDKYLSGGRKLTAPQMLRIAREVARGLADAHEQGLIHRDIKPANIWLDKAHNGRAIILDFGLARFDADAHLTHSGAVVGTPAFMAPEQARGEKVDARADLFSFGCVLYRLCSGELPFKGASTMAVLTALATVDPPSVSSLNPEIPPGLSDLIEDLLKKDPIKRPRSAREVLNLLVEISKAPSSPPTVVPSAKSDPAPNSPTIGAPSKPVSPPPKSTSSDLNPFADATPATPAPQQSLVDAIAQSRTEPNSKPAPKKATAKKTKPPAKKSPLIAWIAAGFGGLALLVGIVFFWPTPDGVVRFEIDDPAVQVTIDKNGPTITGADVKPISLKPGPHGLTITRGDFTFDTKSFQIRKADKAVLKVEWLPGKVQVLHNGAMLDAKDLPKKEVAAPSTTPKPPTPPVAAATPPPAVRDLSPVAQTASLFNGVDLSGWDALPNVWSVKDGTIVGKTPPEGLKANTFLCTKNKYRDFELSCKVKIAPENANTGVQFRSVVSRADTFSMTGPQADIGAAFWGSLYGENFGGMLKQGAPAAVRPNDFIDYYVRCVGKHVTIKVNGQTTVDADVSTLPDEGLIGLQLHAGKPAEVVFRDIQFKEIASESVDVVRTPAPPATPSPSKPQWTSLFNGANLNGWQMDGGEPGTWTVRDGVIVATAASGRQESWLLSTNDYGDCIVAFEFSSVAAVNSGFAFRAVPGEKSSGKDVFASHPQIEIFGERSVGKTGTFVAGFNPIVQQAASAHEKRKKGEENWNDMEVEIRGQQLKVRLNGTQVLSTDIDALIAKGANYPGLKRRAGRIGFQRLSGGRIRFRNIRIQELAGAPATASAQEVDSRKRVDLFDGRSLSGWTAEGRNGWSAQNGVLVGETDAKSGVGYLMTDRTYKDFDLELEYRISSEGNSGVFVRSRPGAHLSGGEFPEIQILDDDAPAFAGVADKGKTGAFYGKAERRARPEAPAGRWNTMTISVQRQHVTVSVNNVTTVDGEFPSVSPDGGRIGLQLYPGRIEFRNIRIREPSAGK